MLTHYRRPVSLSLISTDLPILSSIETAGTLYQKDAQWFHLTLNHQAIPNSQADTELNWHEGSVGQLLWLEISPYRVVMTMQGKSKYAYRHFWEQGIYGISRYWLNGDNPKESYSFRLRNFTRRLTLKGGELPEYLRVEYELWSHQIPLGRYALHLEIHQ